MAKLKINIKGNVDMFLKEYEKLCLKYELVIGVDRYYDTTDVREYPGDMGDRSLDFQEALRIEIECLRNV